MNRLYLALWLALATGCGQAPLHGDGDATPAASTPKDRVTTDAARPTVVTTEAREADDEEELPAATGQEPATAQDPVTAQDPATAQQPASGPQKPLDPKVAQAAIAATFNAGGGNYMEAASLATPTQGASGANYGNGAQELASSYHLGADVDESGMPWKRGCNCSNNLYPMIHGEQITFPFEVTQDQTLVTILVQGTCGVGGGSIPALYLQKEDGSEVAPPAALDLYATWAFKRTDVLRKDFDYTKITDLDVLFVPSFQQRLAKGKYQVVFKDKPAANQGVTYAPSNAMIHSLTIGGAGIVGGRVSGT